MLPLEEDPRWTIRRTVQARRVADEATEASDGLNCTRCHDPHSERSPVALPCRTCHQVLPEGPPHAGQTGCTDCHSHHHWITGPAGAE